MPQEIDELTRRMTQLQIEKQALSREDNPVSKQRLGEIESEIASCRRRSPASKRSGRTRRASSRRSTI